MTSRRDLGGSQKPSFQGPPSCREAHKQFGEEQGRKGDRYTQREVVCVWLKDGYTCLISSSTSVHLTPFFLTPGEVGPGKLPP